MISGTVCELLQLLFYLFIFKLTVMKKIIPFILVTTSVIVVMAACTRNPYAVQPAVTADTTGFAQFREWKAMNELESAIALRTAVAPRKTNTVYKSGSMTSSTTNEAKVAKKKGWSKAAKYSVIGAGSGAILGAVINKRNRVAGGIIGGVLGGGVGYGIGRSNDKKDGRL